MAIAPFFPIIYVRGYAMTEGEQDETTADPFCGFNLGSTVYRATADKTKPAKKFIFESPVLRLSTDFGYTDVFQHGLDILDPDWSGTIPTKSVVIYRYYEEASSLLGTGKTPTIEHFATGLSRLILRVRDLVCADENNELKPADFRCYLVAHSMGGLVCRAFLQNRALGDEEARGYVDKVFTYATPHNGIEIAGLNVPKWFGAMDIDNFNRENMARYLDIEALFKRTGRVDWMPEESFPSDRFFCMIGSNRADYDAAAGVSRTFAGHGSDGLVKIENASVWGVNKQGKLSGQSATAYAYRSHSGYFGIVNSEEAYQNLTRFLFGDVRVDVWFDVEAVRLPPEIEGKAVNALYQIECMAAPRGKRWYLTRRVCEEDSVACRTHQEMTDPGGPERRKIFLSTVFLANRGRVKQDRPSLAYGVTLAIRVPDYEVERSFFPDSHFEGRYLFRDTVLIEMTPPQTEDGKWSVSFAWQGVGGTSTMASLAYKTMRSGKMEISVPVQGLGNPGITGKLRFVASAWN